MDSDQYEELCRHFIAKKVGLSVEDVKSVKIPNPQRPDLPAYQHQIDLYWETGNDISLYLNIANAKWRGSDKVDQADVLLLQQVRQKVASHKAFMISNVGFTSGAFAAARDDGIALHVVTPSFDASLLPRGDRPAIRATLQQMADSSPQPIFNHSIEHRGLDFASASPAPPPPPGPWPAARPGERQTRVVSPPENRALGGPERRGGPALGNTGRGPGPERKG